jgi:hypothetical protein
MRRMGILHTYSHALLLAHHARRINGKACNLGNFAVDAQDTRGILNTKYVTDVNKYLCNASDHKIVEGSFAIASLCRRLSKARLAIGNELDFGSEVIHCCASIGDLVHLLAYKNSIMKQLKNIQNI